MDTPPSNSGCSVGLYLVLAGLGLNTQLCGHTIWIQLPAMMPQLPEGQELPTYLVVVLTFTNISALAYILLHKYAPYKLSEVPFIYTSYALTLTSILLTALFWNTTSKLGNSDHSFLLIGCSVLAGLGNSLATVTYISYAASIHARYVTAVLFGGVWAAVIPHLLALAQGVGQPQDCNPFSVVLSNHSDTIRRFHHDHGTTNAPLIPPRLHFPEKVFFFAITGVMFLSGVAFVVSRQMKSSQQHLSEDNVWQRNPDHILDDCPAVHLNDEYKCTEASCSQYHHHHNMMSHTRAQRLSSQESQGHSSILSQSSQYSNPHSSVLYSSSSQCSKTHGGPPVFPLLVMIAFWATFITEGPLSSVRAFSCYPMGNKYFIGGVLTSNFFKAICCPLSLKLYRRSRITVIVALTSLATITLAYFAALIGFNLTMGGTDSLIFEGSGELLGTVAWVTVAGLFTLALATIGMVSAEAGPVYVTWYIGAIQAGTALGTLCLLKYMSVCKIYRHVDGCKYG